MEIFRGDTFLSTLIPSQEYKFKNGDKIKIGL